MIFVLELLMNLERLYYFIIRGILITVLYIFFVLLLIYVQLSLFLF